MKPYLGFIVMALVWSLPLASFTMWYVRRTNAQARRRLQIAVDQINRDTRSSTVGDISPGTSRLAHLVTRGAQTI